ncbi:cell wall-binding repeat-containing protein [Alkalihalobacillus macyae]|uniref:cell wall-binding repeat-containing protein n=1 Tax=Guptibacillus hwajinpoensis TaxID=208199 RepID=UPI00273AD03D|nr:cell wall-binding repeat-containing protein [Alkalihalobacillus macyae]MDP4551608.1 cell wall-binding repeat-containing protein [Alkalihalobacillus macyae]
MKKGLIRLVIAFLLIAGVGASATGERTAGAEEFSYNEISEILTEEAIKREIPPEVAKAVALEESGWDQSAINKESNNRIGLGIMQVTIKDDAENKSEKERLQGDLRYNIQRGLDILNDKFEGKAGKLPTINDNDREMIESWYFAVLAYNSQTQVNSPVYRNKDDDKFGERNLEAYQEKVFKSIYLYSLLEDYAPVPFGFEVSDFRYNSEDTDDSRLYFETTHYELPEKALHHSTQTFNKSNIVFTAESAKFRAGPSTESAKLATANGREVVTLQSGPLSDKSNEYNTSAVSNSSEMPLHHLAWYEVKLEDGRTAYIASADLLPLIDRLSGSDRYETSVSISQEGWPNGADTVVLARGDAFPDALAGTPLAYQEDAPLLLTMSNGLKEATQNELERLNTNKVIILGSENAISENVVKEIKAINNNVTIERLGGVNRYDTAAIISDKLSSDTAVLSYGRNFPDALSIAPYAAKNGYPVFLTDNKKELSKETKAKISSFDHVIVVGGSDVVSDNAVQGLKYDRYSGENRYNTNIEINKNLKMGNDKAYFATGKDFPDALSGAVLAAKNNSPLFLSPGEDLTEETVSSLKEQSFDQFGLFGGKDVLDVEGDLLDVILSR